VTIVIDKPIDVGEFTLDRRDELIQKVRDVIVKNFHAYGGDERSRRKE
jgi:hypothetical protein